MSTAIKESKASSSDTRPLVAVMTMLVLLATAMRLLAIDLDHWRTYQRMSESTSAIVPFGSLTGVTTGHAQWIVATDSDEYVLLFSVAASTADADTAFWRAVASTSQRDGHHVQFVGVCDSGERCAVSQESPAITMLSYMDPIQMHVAAIARRQRRALLYRGQQLTASLIVAEDASSLAADIAREITKGGRR